MRVPVVVLLCLLFLLGPAAAEEEKKAPPKPLTTEQAADAVLAAVKSKEEAALKALAEKDNPDPWLVADQLCYRGEHDAAEAFAKAAPRVDVEKLPAYVEAWRKREPDKAERELLAAMNAALQTGAPATVEEGTASLGASLDTMVLIRLAHVRGIALRRARRLGESQAVLRRAGDTARALGWLPRASALYAQAGLSAWQGSDWTAALEDWEERLVVATRRGDRAGAATTLGNLGAAHRHLGAYAKALSLSAQALAQMEALGDRAGAARTLGDIGSVHHNLGDYPKALSTYRRALALQEALGDEAGAARTLGNIGNVHRRLGDYATALSNYERVLARMQALGDRAGAAASLGNLGNLHMDLGNYATALSLQEQALAQMEALGDKAGVARTLGAIGNVHHALGDYATALSFGERALAQMEALGDRAGAATTLGNIGGVYDRLGDYAKALSIYDRALSQQEALGDKAGAARTLGNLGNVHFLLGDYAKALSAYQRALKRREALGDRAGAARTLGNIGSVHMALGDITKALSTYQRALAQKEALGTKADAAETLGNLGSVYVALGDYAKALSFQERALVQMEALGDKAGAAHTLGNIGIVHFHLGDYAKARSCQERALAQKEALGNKAGAAATLCNLGNVHLTLGDYAKGLSTYERALVQMEALGDKAGAARTLGNLGHVHMGLGDFAKALSIFERALALMEALGDRAGAATALGNIGRANGHLGDFAAAQRALERAVRSARRLRAVPVLVSALRSLTWVYLDAGSPSRALATAQQALREVETLLGGLGEEQGATAREAQGLLFSVGALAAVRVEDPAEAVAFLESGRAGALLDALGKRQVLRWKAESLPPELLMADREAHAAESVARHAYDRAIKQGHLMETRRAAKRLDDATDVVREVAGRIQRELKQQAGLFYPRAETIEGIESALEKDQALVLYGLCLDEALALVLRQDGERIVSLGKVTEVEAACAALDATDPGADPAKALAALKALLVDPLKLGEDVKQVLVSPEGPLCYLPFGALFEQTTTMTPSGTTHVLLLDEEREAGKGVLSLGNPDYAGISESAKAIYYRGRTLSTLVATGPEAEAIGTTTLIGAKASEAGLRDAIPKAERWKAVHFACHGLIDVERPMLSSLALSSAGEDDGFLTALEVLRMQIPADLAVLSACETGKGKVVKGEGIVGLTRAFMFAGAPRVICSLWKVDDESTQALMVKFYELWNPKTGKGLGAAEALKRAQAFVRDHENGKWKHPYYWAAWVLWGLAD